MLSLFETLAALVRINSVNSAYEGPGEGEIAAWVERYFQELGVEVWRQEVFPGRPNIIARLPGRNSGVRLVLEAHLDTVSAAGMRIAPFEPLIQNGRLHGRGACDTKAGLAAMMHALATLKAENQTPPCEVLLAAVVDEEHSYRGVVKFCEGLRAEAAIVAEPTELRLVIATKGVLRLRIATHGRSAHSSKPDLGVNAINHMARLVLALEEHHAGMASLRHPLTGCGTCSVGVIEGGRQVNQVADQCVIEIDRRLLPGQCAASALGEYRSLIAELADRHAGFQASIEDPPLLVDEALDTPAESTLVQTAAAVLRDLGLRGEPAGVPFGCDASKLARAGVPSIVFGPGSIDRAHTAEEYVELDQVEQAFEFHRRFLLSFGA